MIERRNRLRRAVFGGLVLGALAGVLLGGVEAAAALVSAALAFDTTGERVRFVLASLALAAGGAALAGAGVGAVVGSVSASTSRMLTRSRPRRIWEARAYTVLCAPWVTLATARLFAGRRAKLLPAHDLLVMGGGLALLALLYGALRATQGIALRISRGSLGTPAATTLAAVLLAVAAAALQVDRRVLPRLYLPMHLGLEAGALALGATGICFAYLALLRRGTRRLGQLLQARPVLVIALVLSTASAWALRRMGREATLRSATFEHTALLSHLLGGAHALGIARAAPLPPPPQGTGPPAIAGPLPDGPHLPGADVFLITVDAMRADRLVPRTAPRLATLADASVRFESAYTQVPHTSFSIATLLTGKYMYSLSALGDDPAHHETLADIFKKDRYKTAAFYPPSIFYIDRDKFNIVEINQYNFEYVKYEYMEARGRTDQVIAFLEAEKPERTFAWVHYFDAHEPYELHEGVLVDGRVPVSAVERYDGEVAYVDREVGRLIDYLRAHRPRAVIAFTADHGEEFGEHGGHYHGTTLYEEQVHVPLLVNAPGLAPQRIHAPVGLVDVGPTLLGLVDIVPSARMRGHDLGPWLGAHPAAPDRLGPAYAEIGTRKLVASSSERLIVDVQHDTFELYDVASDPGEKHNLAGSQPERAAAARARLEAWMADQSRFEKGIDAGGDRAVRRLLERGRMGDRAVTRDLAQLLSLPHDKLRAEATMILVRLPPDPATLDAIQAARAALRTSSQRASLPLELLAFRLGERGEPSRPLVTTLEAAVDDPDLAFRAHVALALAEAGDERRAVAMAVTALPGVADEDLEKRLLAMLGRSGERGATEPLLDHLGNVRTRADTVRALGATGDRRAVRPILKLLDGEPYVTVRAAAAEALGALGDRAAVPVLRKLWKGDAEGGVRVAAMAALARLGDRSAKAAKAAVAAAARATGKKPSGR